MEPRRRRDRIAHRAGRGAATTRDVLEHRFERGGDEHPGVIVSNEGPGVLIVVAIPVLLVALPLLLRGAQASYRSRVVIAVVLGVFVVLGVLSIGLFFVPTLIAMIVSISAQSTIRTAPTSSPRPGSST